MATQLFHHGRHRAHKILFGNAACAVRIEFVPDRRRAGRLKRRRRIHGLERLHELVLGNRTGTSGIDLIEQVRHLLGRRHRRARARLNMRCIGGTRSINERIHVCLGLSHR